jgi:hypothetical protein
VGFRHYEHRKKRDQLKAWAASDAGCLLTDQDECWFSRFAQMSLVNAEFIIRARHNRKLQVYNDRLDR